VVITGYDSVFLYVQLVSILSDHIVQSCGYVQLIPKNLCIYFKLTSFKLFNETLQNLTDFTEI